MLCWWPHLLCYRTLSGVGGRSKIHTARPWLKKKPALAPSLSLNETESSEEEPASVAAAASTQVNDDYWLTLINLSLFYKKINLNSRSWREQWVTFFWLGIHLYWAWQVKAVPWLKKFHVPVPHIVPGHKYSDVIAHWDGILPLHCCYWTLLWYISFKSSFLCIADCIFVWFVKWE